MTLADRFRARLLRGRLRELEGPRPLLALPAPPRRRRQGPVEDPLCPRCGTRHPPRSHPTTRTGLAALYGRQVVADPGRPESLNRQANDELLLLLGRHRPWYQP